MGLTTASTVTWGGAGDVAKVGFANFMLYTQCDRAIRAYYCTPCDQKLANRCQLEMHLEHAGEHHIVSWCERHGFEGCTDPR